jgi:acyl-coenzyme A thioesterase PaaI-like protein
MGLADSAAYLLILAHIGPVALAVTTNLNIHFMRKPDPGEIFATGSLLKLGSRIAVVEVRLHGADPPELFAHATVTYSIPPPR